MAKFSRFDPRNKKNGRHKKMSIGEYPKNKKNTFDVDEDRLYNKYKKIDFVDEEAEEELGWPVR
tara:strand:- start:19616 stop:19807 length:192 start_codon:yes stop_codon:yes gene_type:complete